MQLYPIEATNGFNWGKFAIGRHETREWAWRSGVSGSRRSLLGEVGWSPEHLWVLDLQTGEGALFLPHGTARADLRKHRIWVCPMYEPFLEWLYRQDLSDLSRLPTVVEVDAPVAFTGYRRPGPSESGS